MSVPESERRVPADLDSLLSLKTPPLPDDGFMIRDVEPEGETGELRTVEIDAIVPNEFQPRSRFDGDSLSALTESIRELGVLQPLLLRPAGPGRYELIAGERRWRAARRAGLRRVPAVIRITGDQHSLEQAIVENLHREDLHALEEAAAYRQLVEDFGLTQEQVAVRVGKSRSAVSNTLRLFQLPASIQRMISDGVLSAGHARAILGLPSAEAQIALAERAVAEDLSVRGVEDAAKEAFPSTSASRARAERSAGRSKSAGALEIEAVLADLLATGVEIVESAGTGKIVIRFADRDDLDRIYRLLSD